MRHPPLSSLILAAACLFPGHPSLGGEIPASLDRPCPNAVAALVFLVLVSL